jgi:cytochrome P450
MKRIRSWDELYVKTNTPVDINDELSKIILNNVLANAFGEDNFEEYQHVLQGILKLFFQIITRPYHIIYALFPFLVSRVYFPWESEMKKNAQETRTLIKGMINKRRGQINSGMQFQNNHDLLTTLLYDEQYKDNTEMIIDECIAFYMAGFLTTNAAYSNMLVYLLMDERCRTKVLKEVEEKVIQPYMSEHSELNLEEAFSYDVN